MSSKPKSGPKGQESTGVEGEFREKIDYEALAREETVVTFMRMLDEDVTNAWWNILGKLQNGESVSYEELHSARHRMEELDHMVSEFLYKVGDLTDVQAREHGIHIEPEYSEYLAKQGETVGYDGDE